MYQSSGRWVYRCCYCSYSKDYVICIPQEGSFVPLVLEFGGGSGVSASLSCGDGKSELQGSKGKVLVKFIHSRIYQATYTGSLLLWVHCSGALSISTVFGWRSGADVCFCPTKLLERVSAVDIKSNCDFYLLCCTAGSRNVRVWKRHQQDTNARAASPLFLLFILRDSLMYLSRICFHLLQQSETGCSVYLISEVIPTSSFPIQPTCLLSYDLPRVFFGSTVLIHLRLHVPKASEVTHCLDKLFIEERLTTHCLWSCYTPPTYSTWMKAYWNLIGQTLRWGHWNRIPVYSQGQRCWPERSEHTSVKLVHNIRRWVRYARDAHAQRHIVNQVLHL